MSDRLVISLAYGLLGTAGIAAILWAIGGF